MHKLRTKLAVSAVLLVGLSVIVAGIVMGEMYKSSHIRAMEEHLIVEAKLIAALGEWPGDGGLEPLIAFYTRQAALWKKTANVRVTIIRADGVVLGDSDHDPLSMDNHADREEIQQAKAGGTGMSIRRSETLGQSRMYVAVPLPPEAKHDGYVRLSKSLEEVESGLRRLWLYWTAGFVLLMGLIAIASFRLSRKIIRPLEHIEQVAYKIANRDFSSRVVTDTEDEIGSLGKMINRMADSLQRQMQQNRDQASKLTGVLDNMISGVVMIDRDGRIALMNRSAGTMLNFDVRSWIGKLYTEAERHPMIVAKIKECMATREPQRQDLSLHDPDERLIEAHFVPIHHEDGEWAGTLVILQDMTAIRRLERMRSEFVANVSHELKTPVAAVKGFAETLLAGAIHDQETAASFLKIIYDESDRLNRLVGDLLDLSKIESRKIPLSFSPVHLHAFMHKVLEMMRAEAAKKRIALEAVVDDTLYIEADEDRLQQMIMNLLSNGINYTPEGGKISVIVEAVEKTRSETSSRDFGEDRIRIIIQDTGIGIPKRDLPRIFERFYRVDKARSRSSGGTGLGLSIVKHLVELHHGTIHVESVVGEGTVFTIELPVLQEQVDPN
jgi:two-component system phosphate regulon sensor histidine kinase PhoR